MPPGRTRGRQPKSETDLESQSEMCGEGDGIRVGSANWSIETDGQVPLHEVSLEETILAPDGPTLTHQGSESEL